MKRKEKDYKKTERGEKKNRKKEKETGKPRERRRKGNTQQPTNLSKAVTGGGRRASEGPGETTLNSLVSSARGGEMPQR